MGARVVTAYEEVQLVATIAGRIVAANWLAEDSSGADVPGAPTVPDAVAVAIEIVAEARRQVAGPGSAALDASAVPTPIR